MSEAQSGCPEVAHAMLNVTGRETEEPIVDVVLHAVQQQDSFTVQDVVGVARRVSVGPQPTSTSGGYVPPNRAFDASAGKQNGRSNRRGRDQASYYYLEGQMES